MNPRSHPALTPLTTLPTSPSHSYLTPPSIPTTPSLLSRPSSTTHLSVHHRRTNPPSIPTSKSASALSAKSRKRRSRVEGDDDDWMTRTASTLTLTRLEEKGQSWLVARKSSTSLDGEEDGYLYGPGMAVRGSRGRLQVGNPGSRGSFKIVEQSREDRDGDREIIEPDFVDVDEDLEEGEDVDVEEGEMRKVVMGRVGGWVDWAVGWLDLRADGEGDEDGRENVEGNVEGEADRSKGDLDPVELQRRLRSNQEGEQGGNVENEAGNVPPPPQDERAGTWSDAVWLLHVARMAALE